MIETLNLKYLPYSGRRYIVSECGKLFDNCQKEILPKDGFVELAWIDGVTHYSVGMLVIVTFHPMYLPEHLWKYIEPLYLDEDPTNNSSTNLKYRFTCGLLEYENLKGFYYIPHFTKYVIDKYGNMLTAENGRSKTWGYVKSDLSRNSKGGYRFTRVVNEPGINSVLLRHRALCYTFKPVKAANDYNLLVNHKDGVPGNDHLDNLEWATYSENNQHAHDKGLTGGKNKSVLMRDLVTGKITSFQNIKELAKYLGHANTAQIRHRLRHGLAVYYSDKLQFKWDDNSEWINIDQSETPVCCKIGTLMASRNIFTGEVLTFKTFEEGEKLTGIDKQTISIHIRDKQIIPFQGFNFSWYTENMEWPIHSEINMKAYSKYPVRTPDPIIVEDMILGHQVIVESRNELADLLNISPSYATQLVSNNMVYKDRYKFKYHFLRENILVPSSWKT